MAETTRDPNARVPGLSGKFEGATLKNVPPGVQWPEGVKTDSKDWYVQWHTTQDGRTVYEWYKYGAGGGPGKPDPIAFTSEGAPNTDVKAAWDKADKDAAAGATAAGKNVKSKYPGVFPPGHPLAGQPATVTEYDAGDPDYVAITTPASQVEWRTEGTPLPGGGTDNTKPIMVAVVNGQRQERALTPKELQDWYLAAELERNQGKTDAEIAATTKAATATAQATAGGETRVPVKDKPGVWVVTTKKTDPTTQRVTEETHYEDDNRNVIPTPAAKPAPPTQVTAPASQRLIEDRVENADGTFTITQRKNPNYVKPSVIKPHPSDPNRMVNHTVDDDGNPVILDVDDKTVIKPADLPVLQTTYGQISQGLGQLAADLNGRFARGEITEKQRNDAFAAGHQQAATQIAEINSILENSRQVWSHEITQRGQTLQDTAGRRTFASNVLGQAVSTGENIAISSGPGHGAAIAGGVGALLNIGQRYAEGMGGFRESPEIAAPVALQQARAVPIPGLPMPGGLQPAGPGAPAAPLPPGSPGGPDAAGRLSPPVPGAGVSNTTDAGGVPRVFTPSSSAPQSSAAPGVNPLVQQMQQQLMGGQMFAGSPVAAGGGGVFDPLAEGERMLAGRTGQDTYWEQAVQRAAQAAGQRPGYERFS